MHFRLAWIASFTVLMPVRVLALDNVVIPREKREFYIRNNSWILDGEQFVIKSGSLHYFRVPARTWSDKIRRMKALGLNAVQSYVAWNFHEQNFKGAADFSGQRNLTYFIDLVRQNDMLLLLRPGPYICAEWEFGGLPARLLANENIRLRTNDTTYMREVSRWWGILLPKIEPYLFKHGGPIIMIQVENEYGFYGDASKNPDDAAYLKVLISILRFHLGNEVVLYTTDSASLPIMQRGSLPDESVVTLGDFGPFQVNRALNEKYASNRAMDSIAAQNKMNPTGLSPPMCTEYYTGWFTRWGGLAMKTSSQFVANSLDYMLSINMSVNLYMAHGGTNFGYWSGAGSLGRGVRYYITSYDYNAPIAENGHHNLGSDNIDKYASLKSIFQKYSSEEFPPEPVSLRMGNLGHVPLLKRSLSGGLVAALKRTLTPVEQADVLTFEKLGQRFGFILYSTTINCLTGGNLDLLQVRDHAHVYIDGTFLKTISRDDKDSSVPIESKGSSITVDILVENMGRSNSHDRMYDPKGLVAGVAFNGVSVHDWKHYKMKSTCEHLRQLLTVEANTTSNGPLVDIVYHGYFVIDSSRMPDGTFMDMSNFNKGYAWVNSMNVGRYWGSQGPQLSLFIPREFLRLGKNELLLLEIDGSGRERLGVDLLSYPRTVSGLEFLAQSSLEERR